MATEKPNADEKLTNLAKQLVDLRKNPLLVLDIETVNQMSVIQLEKELRGKQYADLDVLLHTSGGLIEPAFNIVKLLRKHSKKVEIIVPSYAKSAGTLISFGADKLLMGAIAELGPLDVQIRETDDDTGSTYKSALNGFKALEQIQLHALDNLDIATKMIIDRTGSGVKMAEAIKLGIAFSGQTSACLYNQLNPKVIGEYARALEVGSRYAVSILTRYLGWGPDKANEVANKLVYGYPSHGFIIDTLELQQLGLPAEEINDTLKEVIDGFRVALIHKDIQGGSFIKLFEYTPPKTATVPKPVKQNKVITKKK
ncbi:MAG: hypothetical protein COU72_05110 [Parcubacteria group bacterium CG10_big_fil_rev_8_21_14_0_10_41_35]|nr:MAG: hypothetical protein COU72_05110 [Parcubacteria group bacterium CG10_big_fil_rev_8_21_14_0_10_41_35]